MNLNIIEIESEKVTCQSAGDIYYFLSQSTHKSLGQVRKNITKAFEGNINKALWLEDVKRLYNRSMLGKTELLPQLMKHIKSCSIRVSDIIDEDPKFTEFRIWESIEHSNDNIIALSQAIQDFIQDLESKATYTWEYFFEDIKNIGKNPHLQLENDSSHLLWNWEPIQKIDTVEILWITYLEITCGGNKFFTLKTSRNNNNVSWKVLQAKDGYILNEILSNCIEDDLLQAQFRKEDEIVTKKIRTINTAGTIKWENIKETDTFV